jgi:hypothetical protein
MTTNNSPIAYPLYDDLLLKVRARKDEAIDITRVCHTINNIERIVNDKEVAMEHYKEIMWLIMHHHYLTTGVESSLPYDSKVMVGGKGILNYINNMPALLQQIIAQYIEEETNPS